MKEIKFRGMNIKGAWHSGNLAITKIKIDGVAAGCYISNAVGCPFAYQVRPETVGQYTGRHDKNGAEIYQGDIFGNIAALRCVVRRLDDGAYKLVFCDTRMTPWSITDPRVCESEVIGNIYENPELLEGA